MTANWLALLTILLAGGGVGSLITIFVKAGPERQQIILSSAEKALSIQVSVIEGLRTELERKDLLIAALQAENVRLRMGT